MNTIGEIKIHHHRNKITDDLKKIKEEQAWQLFNDMYMGSEPAEAEFIEYTAEKMESGEIQDQIAFRLCLEQRGNGFIIVFMTDDDQPISKTTDFIEWSNKFHGNKIV